MEKKLAALILVCLLAILSFGSSANSQTPGFSHQAGFYDEPFHLNIACPDEFPQAWVTFNGSWPGPDNPESELFTAPILIDSRAGDPNFFSLIPQNNGDSGIPAWLPPTEEVMKASVIGTVCVNPDDGARSEMVFRSYFIGLQNVLDIGLPVLSIVSPPDSLFGHERGIMVPGANYNPGQGTSGNYFQRGDEWERKMHIEFFEQTGDLGFNQFAGIRIHGNFSRSYPMKSVRIYSRSDYGTSRFEYKIFEDQPVQRFNRLIIRNSGQDFNSLIMRDAVSQRFFRNLDIETQDYRPSVKFVNGEFWGLYNIRERYGRHYFERKYEIDRDSLDYLTFAFNRIPSADDGDNLAYVAMLNFVTENDMTASENYEDLMTMMDIDNYINQIVINVYSSNNDWPHTNQRIFRTRNEYRPGDGVHDGRFRWLINDLDRSFGLFNSPAHDNLARLFNDTWYNEIFLELIQNETFRNELINRHADFMHSYMVPETAHAIINESAAKIQNAIPYHVARWQYPASAASWNNRVNSFRNWMTARPENIRNQLIERFDLDGLATFTADISAPNAGVIKLNSIRLAPETDGVAANPYPFEATYFAGVPVRLEAIPNAGYRFDGWLGHDSSEPVITVDPALLETITAVFVFEPFEGDDMNPVAHDLSTGDYLFDFWGPEQPELTFPGNMVFQQTRLTDPGLADEMTDPYFITEDEYHEDDAASLGFPYALTRRTRINALGEDGISFINTGRSRDLGAAVLALDTRATEEVFVNFTAGTVTPNSREYAIRLQYRVGNQVAFTDVTDSSGEPVEYLRNTTSGHETHFSDIRLPDEAAGVPYLQLRWKYYHVDGSNGPRAELRLDNILVRTEAFVSVPGEELSNLPQQFMLHQNYPNPFNPTTNITFDLPVQADIVLEVFNVTGQRVAVLANGSHQAGTHTIAFDARGLASGLYLYRLRTNGTASPVQLTGKMMLLR
ncbi:MAG: CotH kinase family protein [Balneolales bacterium]|nr:CotH kinase family protein [Balneolales bacterium]